MNYARVPLFAIVFTSMLLTVGAQQISPKKVVPFNRSAYPPSKFVISSQNYPLEEISVQIIQVKNKGAGTEPHACPAWFKVKKGDHLLHQVYFDDIDAVGFSFGIFVPKKQPFPGSFVAIKEGDYDGRLLLVSKIGSLTNLPGGFYFLSEDERFLIGEQVRDDSPLIVIDVSRNKVVIDGGKNPKIPQPMNWYRDNTGYFYTEADQSNHEKMGQIYRLDLERLAVTRTPLKTKQFASAHKIAYDFDPRKMQDCTSTPQ